MLGRPAFGPPAYGLCQRPHVADWYCSTTLAGMRPRSLTAMPCSFAQARTVPRCPDVRRTTWTVSGRSDNRAFFPARTATWQSELLRRARERRRSRQRSLFGTALRHPRRIRCTSRVRPRSRHHLLQPRRSGTASVPRPRPIPAVGHRPPQTPHGAHTRRRRQRGTALAWHGRCKAPGGSCPCPRRRS
jgi:hypothetical protein